jgi:hypothetical protein
LITCPAVGAVIGYKSQSSRKQRKHTLSCARTPDAAKRSETVAITLKSIVLFLTGEKDASGQI